MLNDHLRGELRAQWQQLDHDQRRAFTEALRERARRRQPDATPKISA